MSLWPHLEAAKSHVLMLHGLLVMLMVAFLINTVVSPYKFLMPLRGFSDHMEKWANGDSFTELTLASWNHYALYNAVVCCVVTVGLFIAYFRILTWSYACMDSIGSILLQQSKEKDVEQGQGHIMFELAETAPQQPKPRIIMKKTHQAALAMMLFTATVVGLPSLCMHTFAYTIVDGDYFKLTSDHVLVTFMLFFVVKITRGLCYNFSNGPVGFPRAKFAACQFSIAYGSILVLASTLFLSLANDVMFTYIYKVFALYRERLTNPQALAHDVVIPNANYITCSFANYLVDSTYAALDQDMMKEQLFTIFHALVQSYKDMYLDLFQILVFGATVFVPMIMGSLVLFSLDI